MSVMPAIVFTLCSVYWSASAQYSGNTSQVGEDVILTVPELITKNGYPCETHTVVTLDGYILNMHRIPASKNISSMQNSIAFLQHGVLGSSAGWIITGTKKGLAYILADQGYDVWMGNARGNKYSRNHTYLKTDSFEFWDFTWHNIGTHDLPAMIDYILNLTRQDDLYYIGHSQGNTVFYVLCSEKPEYNSKFRAQFSLAPVAYISNVKSPLLQILSRAYGLQNLFELAGVNEFLPSSKLITKLTNRYCKDGRLTQKLCINIIFLLCGYNKKQLNTTLLPTILQHVPAGSSTRQLAHFVQEIRSGHFRKWDYGVVGNVKRYRWYRPPDYKLANVKVPVYLYYAANDWISTGKDVKRLYNELGNGQACILIPDPCFNHLDFVFGIDAPKLVYKLMLPFMEVY